MMSNPNDPKWIFLHFSHTTLTLICIAIPIKSHKIRLFDCRVVSSVFLFRFARSGRFAFLHAQSHAFFKMLLFDCARFNCVWETVTIINRWPNFLAETLSPYKVGVCYPGCYTPSKRIWSDLYFLRNRHRFTVKQNDFKAQPMNFVRGKQSKIGTKFFGDFWLRNAHAEIMFRVFSKNANTPQTAVYTAAVNCNGHITRQMIFSQCQSSSTSKVQKYTGWSPDRDTDSISQFMHTIFMFIVYKCELFSVHLCEVFMARGAVVIISWLLLYSFFFHVIYSVFTNSTFIYSCLSSTRKLFNPMGRFLFTVIVSFVLVSTISF